MVNESSKKGSLYFLLLCASTILVPRGLFDFSYLGFSVIILFYIIVWWKILRYMWLYNIEDDPKQWKDLMVYDLIYMLGLPILTHLIVLVVGDSMWREGRGYLIVQVMYFALLFIGAIFKFSLMRTKFQYFYRFVITMAFIISNIFSVWLIYNLWYGIHNLGQGF